MGRVMVFKRNAMKHAKSFLTIALCYSFALQIAVGFFSQTLGDDWSKTRQNARQKDTTVSIKPFDTVQAKIDARFKHCLMINVGSPDLINLVYRIDVGRFFLP